jgi:hypothetical protein
MVVEDAATILLELLSRSPSGPFHAVALRAAFHMLEGRVQGARLTECLGLLEANAETARRPVPRSTLRSQSDDDRVPAILELYGLTHHAIALYRHLVILAEAERIAAIADLCRQSLGEKVGMAAWFEHQLDGLALPPTQPRTPPVDGSAAGCAPA